MSEVRMPELAKTMPDLGVFAQVGSDATRRLCEQGQCVTNALSAWQSEVSRFLTRRMDRNKEAMARVAKGPNFPEVLAIQAQWMQEATDDYLKEMSKLMEVNSKIMSGILGSVGEVEAATPKTTASPEAQAASKTPASPEASVAPETPASPEVRSAPETPPSPGERSTLQTPTSPETRSPPATRSSPTKATARAEDQPSR